MDEDRLLSGNGRSDCDHRAAGCRRRLLSVDRAASRSSPGDPDSPHPATCRRYNPAVRYGCSKCSLSGAWRTPASRVSFDPAELYPLLFRQWPAAPKPVLTSYLPLMAWFAYESWDDSASEPRLWLSFAKMLFATRSTRYWLCGTTTGGWRTPEASGSNEDVPCGRKTKHTSGMGSANQCKFCLT